MTDFFVRKTGSDAAAGTSAGAAWLTIGKGLGAAGISSGDRLVVGAGVYREAVTVAMTSATVTTSIIGDVDGALTGDAGDVVLTPNTVNDFVASSSSTLTLAGRDFLAFSNIVIVGNSGITVDASSTKTPTDIMFTRCTFLTHPAGNTTIQVAAAANVALNWTIDQCIFHKTNQAAIQFLVDTPATADFNINCLVKNTTFLGGAGTCVIIQQGLTANAFKFGGVTCYHISSMSGGIVLRAVDTNHSTSVTSAIYNSALYNTSGTSIQAFAAGQLVEDYNVLPSSTPRANVTAGAHSVTAYAPLFEVGQAIVTGRALRPYGMPTADSPILGFGAQASGPTVDGLNRNRPSGMRLVASGTATAGAAKTMTDSGATWGVNAWAGYTILLTGGTGSGQSKSIASNTGTVLTVDGNWQTNPDATSTYQVYWGDPSSTGKATAGTTTTLTDSNAAWGTNQWAGYILHIDAGTGSGQSLTVVSNTATAITFAVATAPDSTSTYSIYKATSITTQDYAAGAYERHDHYQKETTTTDAGGVGLKVLGSGDHEIKIPVTATSTTISVKVRWHNAASNKPQVTLLANGEIGVTTETKTATGGVDTWETLTFTPQTPTASGVVTVRLIARPDAATDITYNDTLAVS